MSANIDLIVKRLLDPQFGTETTEPLLMGTAADAIRHLQVRVAELEVVLKRICRGAELQAHVMRDPLRTGGSWPAADKVADAFDDIAERAREPLSIAKETGT